MKKSERQRLMGTKKLWRVSSLLLAATAAVSYMYGSQKQLVEIDPVNRLLEVDQSPSTTVEETFPAEVIPLEERLPDNQIRYASFGSSVTWGSGVTDRENYVYIARMANDPTKERFVNYGIRSTGPNYPAACLHSMIGDEEFDVIVLEFFLRAHEGLLSLGLRLRERFPNAIIFVTRIWSPFQFRHKDQDRNINLADWASEKGFGSGFIHDPKFKEAFLAEGEDNWRYAYEDPTAPINTYHKAAAEAIGAHIINMGFSDHADGPDGWLEQGDTYLASDSFHLSENGHSHLAKQMNDIVQKVGVPKQRTLGKFKGIDYCNTWFESGEVGEGLIASPNSDVYRMPHTNKFVMSFGKEPDPDDKDNVGEEGWIKVNNPSEEMMEVFIAYMTTGPKPSKYPQVEVIRNNNEKTKQILEPDTIGWGDKKVHTARLENLGKINPGAKNELISFRPLEKTVYPFRLVSVAITPINENANESFLRIQGPKIALSS